MSTNEAIEVESLVLNCNKQAMELLRQDNYNEALLLLRKAESLLSHPENLKDANNKLHAITYNNIGCFYKKAGKAQLALQYLQRALEVSKNFPSEYTNLAGTHLNICAIVSQMGDHETGVSHAIKALQLLKKSYDEDGSQNTISTLIIALHNTGVEYEFLGELKKAEETYKCGMDLANKHLGKNHQLALTLTKNYTLLQRNREIIKPQLTKKLYFEKLSSGYSRTRNSMEPQHSSANERTLPKIRTTSGRARKGRKANKSVGEPKRNDSNKMKFMEFLPTTVNQPKKFQRNLLKTAPESQVKKPQFSPITDKPTTSFTKPKHLSIKEDKAISHIENRIETLRSQLDDFENKYKELEKNASKKPLSKLDRQALTPSPPLLNRSLGPIKPVSPPSKNNYSHIITIQKHWRGYKARKDFKIQKRLEAQEKAKAAIEELEILKKRAMDDNLYQDLEEHVRPKSSAFPIKKPEEKVRPKTNSSAYPPPNVNFRPLKSAQKTLKFQLDPIPESRIETKTDRAILIQSHIRRFISQKKYKKMKNAAMKIQKNIRRHQCKSLYQDILSAVLFIQAFWRGHLVRKKYLKKEKHN
ncbi:unnamed protein product [Blepharisma stoltei]|uniref:Uncharacterized protein n=1 Tax=Blepharisma stoltei TaxID=1481888 RepID=A0AAU9IV69_9CILI|nr:unnamed protein product [Blepharisma stoltei]